jgi:hypothetical protein
MNAQHGELALGCEFGSGYPFSLPDRRVESNRVLDRVIGESWFASERD